VAVLCGVAIVIALAAQARAAGGPPQGGSWRALGTEFKGTFAVGGGDVSRLHGTVGAAAAEGCPIAHLGQTLTIPSQLPIFHNPASGSYEVIGKDFLMRSVEVVLDGQRDPGFISIGWVSARYAQVAITLENARGAGCKIGFFAVPS